MDVRGVSANPGVSPDIEKKKKELMKACQDFESIFLNIMLQEMRNSVPKDDLTEKSFGRDIFESMLYEKYADEMAKTNSVGLAKIIYDQLSKNLK